MQESNASPEISHIQNSFENKYADDKKYSKNRDHCHYRGKYRGATHNICNLKIVYLKILLHFFAMDQTMIINFVIKEQAKRKI